MEPVGGARLVVVIDRFKLVMGSFNLPKLHTHTCPSLLALTILCEFYVPVIASE